MSIGSTIVPRADLDLCAYHLYNSYSLDTVTFQRRLSLAVGSFVCDRESNWPAFFLSPIYLIRMNHCDRRYLDVATDERSFIFFNCVVLFFFFSCDLRLRSNLYILNWNYNYCCFNQLNSFFNFFQLEFCLINKKFLNFTNCEILMFVQKFCFIDFVSLK